jgi:Xaa-Pro dipeptidase
MFKDLQGENLPQNAIGLFKGANEVHLYSSDVSYPEYQEAFFYYLFGVTEMDSYAIIDFTNEKTILFLPKMDNTYKIWMTVWTLPEFKERYNLVDEIYFVEHLEQFIKEHNPATIFVNSGVNSDSGLKTCIPDEKYTSGFKVDDKFMHNVLAESRVIKNDEEIEIMRWASKITCEAHCNVMRSVKPGQRESQLESFFKYDCEQRYFCGRV